MIKPPPKSSLVPCRSRFQRSAYFFVLFVGALLHSGCAVWPQPTRSVHVGASSPVGRCADFFAALDDQTAASNAVDAGFTRVKHYPYLRTNRLMGSFRNEVGNDDAFSAWIDQLQALDQSARRAEIANLSNMNMAGINMANGIIAATKPVDDKDELYRTVIACGDLLKAVDFSSSDNRDKLRQEVSAKDDYLILRRWLGLYPITNLFVSQGVKRWHAKAREGFSLDPQASWQTVRYAPGVKPDVSAAYRIVRSARRNKLGIPVYETEDQKTLLHLYAPVWVVQTHTDDDRIGAPAWKGGGRIHVDIGKPFCYTRFSFTRFANKILTQLNYIIWFPSRPKDGTLDIYGGLLDGINYRVTLDTSGQPIAYETIHNCGCYYKAYPTSRLRAHEKVAYAEPPLILKAPEINPAQESMAVGIEAGTHYVRQLYPLSRDVQSATKIYDLADYTELQRLTYVDGSQKSMFDRYGIVPGTQRLERFVLWPTGVLSPGAMRQWGRHAVAFVGRRHFDDPFYLDKMFKIRE